MSCVITGHGITVQKDRYTSCVTTSCWFMTHLRMLKSYCQNITPVCSSMIPILEESGCPHPRLQGKRRSLWDYCSFHGTLMSVCSNPRAHCSPRAQLMGTWQGSLGAWWVTQWGCVWGTCGAAGWGVG